MVDITTTYCNIKSKQNDLLVMEGGSMLSWTVTLLILALIMALVGFTGLAGAAAGMAKILFAVFLVLFIVGLLFGRRPHV